MVICTSTVLIHLDLLHSYMNGQYLTEQLKAIAIFLSASSG